MMHFISATCKGEVCGICLRENVRVSATHKVGEEFPYDAPPEMAMFHNLTQYVCCRHFGMIVRPESAAISRGCEQVKGAGA